MTTMKKGSCVIWGFPSACQAEGAYGDENPAQRTRSANFTKLRISKGAGAIRARFKVERTGRCYDNRPDESFFATLEERKKLYAEERKTLSNQDGSGCPWHRYKSIVIPVHHDPTITAGESILPTPAACRQPCIVRPPEAWPHKPQILGVHILHSS